MWRNARHKQHGNDTRNVNTWSVVPTTQTVIRLLPMRGREDGAESFAVTQMPVVSRKAVWANVRCGVVTYQVVCDRASQGKL